MMLTPGSLASSPLKTHIFFFNPEFQKMLIMAFCRDQGEVRYSCTRDQSEI